LEKESEWRKSLYEQGLLNWGFTRAAESLDLPGLFITDYPPNLPATIWAVELAGFSQQWQFVPIGPVDPDQPFPYGWNVEPPY
jgi:hypothetical protein